MKRKSPQGALKQETYRKHPVLLLVRDCAVLMYVRIMYVRGVCACMRVFFSDVCALMYVRVCAPMRAEPIESTDDRPPPPAPAPPPPPPPTSGACKEAMPGITYTPKCTKTICKQAAEMRRGNGEGAGRGRSLPPWRGQRESKCESSNPTARSNLLSSGQTLLGPSRLLPSLSSLFSAPSSRLKYFSQFVS